MYQNANTLILEEVKCIFSKNLAVFLDSLLSKRKQFFFFPLLGRFIEHIYKDKNKFRAYLGLRLRNKVFKPKKAFGQKLHF
jgi:hypothetical protein